MWRVVHISVFKFPIQHEVKMKSGLAQKLRALAMVVCASLAYSIAFAAVQDKQQSKDDAPKISEGEQKAIEKINTASGVAEKLKAAAEYVKKNGKSQMRPRVAAYVSDEISKVTDHNQRIGFVETFTKAFNLPEEADLIKPTLIESLIGSNKFEEAFNEGSKHVERKPDDVIVLTMLASAGANQAQKQIQSSQAPSAAMMQKASEAGAKAVELLEADKKPEKMDPTYWNNFRNTWLPRLYQAQGVILFANNDKAAAKDKLEKAAGLDPYDPNTLLMISGVLNEEYTKLAERYQTEKKQALLTEALQKMDELIEWLARAAAATEGNAQNQAVNGQIMDQLKNYYAFRHEGKTDGLKELIQKYKKP
jgi:tetratricopeptide (TPR) repeat protein